MGKNSLPGYQHRSLQTNILYFVGLMVLIEIPILSVAYVLQQDVGLKTAIVAFAICLNAGILALLADHLLRKLGQEPMIGVLSSMLIRMTLTLLPAMYFVVRKGHLLQSGVLYYLIITYLATLWIEVLLLLPRKTRDGRPPRPDDDNPADPPDAES